MQYIRKHGSINCICWLLARYMANYAFPKKVSSCSIFLINLYELQPLKIIPTVTIDGAIVTNSLPPVFTYYHIIGAIGLSSSSLFLLLSDKIKMKSSNLLHEFSTCTDDLIYTFFSYFIIVRKSIRTFTNEFSIFGGNIK